MALAMASLVHTASSTVLLRVIISPRVTTEFDVRASVSSEGTTPSRSDTEGREGEKKEFDHQKIRLQSLVSAHK